MSEYWSGLPFPSLGDLPDQGIKPTSPAMTGGFFTTQPPGKPSLASTNHALSTCRFILCETNFCEFEPLLIRFSVTNKSISVTQELWAVGKDNSINNFGAIQVAFH